MSPLCRPRPHGILALDWAARWGGEPYWRAASTADLVAVAQKASFVDVDGGVLPGGRPYILVARKPEAAR
ncbi:MAG: hypothetical protein U5M50_16125 [Sphingobium sp.]|nr:hypothetical protein [Sphingobium sp.]